MLCPRLLIACYFEAPLAGQPAIFDRCLPVTACSRELRVPLFGQSAPGPACMTLVRRQLVPC